MSAKRLLDLVLATSGLIALSPVLSAIALWIKWDSPGPVLFRQTRVGKLGRPFDILKFRTMPVGAEIEGPKITVRGDSRVTRSGVFLRRKKLDELPQLLNVIRGEMSLVGPRPEVPEYVAQYPASVRGAVLSLRPGITDFAAIEFRDESELLEASPDPHKTYVEEILPAKLELYQKYIREQSFWLDVRLILRTIGTILA